MTMGRRMWVSISVKAIPAIDVINLSHFAFAITAHSAVSYF
jgi:hypothetical protein